MAPKKNDNVVKMTHEMAEQLRGILPVSINARRRFTPSIFIDKNFPKQFAPVFVLRPLTRLEQSEIWGTDKAPQQVVFDLLSKGIDTVENFWDIDKCEIVEFTSEYIDLLDGIAISELQSEILMLSTLKKAERLGLK